MVTVKRGQKITTTRTTRKMVSRRSKETSGGRPGHVDRLPPLQTLQFQRASWVKFGQWAVNMEWPLNKSFQPEADIATRRRTPRRFVFLVPKKQIRRADHAHQVRVGGLFAGSDSGHSAVGYYFGRDLQQARKVRV